MLIGELAIQAGVNVQTIRFYERRGLLKSRGAEVTSSVLCSPYQAARYLYCLFAHLKRRGQFSASL